MKKYRCKLCGYIYEGESLSLSFECPICGVDYSNFVEYEEDFRGVKIDESNPSIHRIEEKCINCGQCKSICEGALCYKNEDGTLCINCGQCILGCPSGALVPKYSYKEVDKIIASSKRIVIAFTSPAVRVSLGEEFNMPYGSFVEGKMVSALKELGFNYVFDTTFGADITVVEEVNELIDRINSNGVLPMFSSCCPSWVKYAEVFLPNLLPNISTCKSPISMQSALIKNYISKVKNINKEDIVTVAITPCTAKKMEAIRHKNTDYVLTVSELAIYMRERNIDFNSLIDSEFDSLMGKGSGSGVIFGNSGGVMEASLRTLYFYLTGENLKSDMLKIMDLRGDESIKEASILINGKEYNVAVIYGMDSVNKFIPKMKSKNYVFVEVMNCPNGCIGGGGQPLKAIGKLKDIRKERIKSLYKNGDESVCRFSHENKDVLEVYDKYLGKPNSETARNLLHTEYSDKSSLVKNEINV